MDIDRTTTALLEGLFDSDNELAWSWKASRVSVMLPPVEFS